jgi:hypothetical protein
MNITEAEDNRAELKADPEIRGSSMNASRNFKSTLAKASLSRSPVGRSLNFGVSIQASPLHIAA